jgi:PhnB protein
MATVHPYFNFLGNTEEVFNFYRSVFGGEFLNLTRFSDMPDMSGNLSDADKNKIMHIALPINKEVMLMGTDALESLGQTATNGTSISLAITPDSKEDGERIFKALSAGGSVEVPYDKAPWGAWFAMFNDKYGIKWMVNFEEK